MKPRQVYQQALDTMLEQAPAGAKARFERAVRALPRQHDVGPADPPARQAAEPLTVAIAVVVTDSDVLIVCRRDNGASGISWQFPAGVVKPAADPRTVAVRETSAETGVHCAIRARLGRRLHPVTGVLCEYFLCDYLAGEPQNLDVVENASVMWIRRHDITRFIPEDRIYEPVLRELLEDHEAAAS
jgi:8-oxo-dGTP diphosphatase